MNILVAAFAVARHSAKRGTITINFGLPVATRTRRFAMSASQRPYRMIDARGAPIAGIVALRATAFGHFGCELLAMRVFMAIETRALW